MKRSTIYYETSTVLKNDYYDLNDINNDLNNILIKRKNKKKKVRLKLNNLNSEDNNKNKKMILPSGEMDFDSLVGPESTYFALQPSNLSSPSSDEFVGSRFINEPTLEHAHSRTFSGLLYYCWHKPCVTSKRGVAAIGIVVIIVILVIIFAGSQFGSSTKNNNNENLVPEDPEIPPPPSWSKLRTFKNGAICADGAPCAFIGKTMLERNGSAVDAAIATLICNGLVNMQSMGFGGGFFMTIYIKKKKQAFVLNARDSAPNLAHTRLFDGKNSEDARSGGLSIAVPGELAGYWTAHHRFGKLPWRDLFIPSIELCQKGYNLTKAQYDALLLRRDLIFADPTLKSLFVDPDTGDFRKPGAIIRPKKLCETMKILSEEGAGAFYNGTLGNMLISDIRKRDSILTRKDLNTYRALWQEPLVTNLSNGMTVYTNNLPGGGSLLSMILNVFDKYKFTPNDISNDNNTIKTYHRMLETFKYAYAVRTEFGDINLTKLIQNITSKEFAESIKSKINDSQTWNDPKYYGVQHLDQLNDHGTAHISVIAPNGDAVSVTSTINIYFGSCIVSENTGILLNDGMDDFSIPERLNYFGIPPNPNNYIAPGKRPLSSMTPTILIDKNGDVQMVIGAAGGTKIITSIAYVIARHFWLGDTIKEAIDAPRIHHQIYPMKVSYEYGVTKNIINGLKKLGHETERYRYRGSVICALVKINNTIFANADYRKGGDVYGID